MDHMKKILAKTVPIDQGVLQSYNALNLCRTEIGAASIKKELTSDEFEEEAFVEEQEPEEMYVPPLKRARRPSSPNSISLATLDLPFEGFDASFLFPEIVPPQKQICRCKVIRVTPKNKDHSLGSITKQFVDYLLSTPERKCTLNEAAVFLCIRHRRRLYDVINALEGIGLIEKKKNLVKWIAADMDPDSRPMLKYDIAKEETEIEALDRKELALETGIRLQNIRMMLSQADNLNYMYHDADAPAAAYPGKHYIVVQAQPGMKLNLSSFEANGYKCRPDHQLAISGCLGAINGYVLEQGMTRKDGNKPKKTINPKIATFIKSDNDNYIFDHDYISKAPQGLKYSVVPIEPPLTPPRAYETYCGYDRTNLSDLYADDDMLCPHGVS